MQNAQFLFFIFQKNFKILQFINFEHFLYFFSINYSLILYSNYIFNFLFNFCFLINLIFKQN